MAVTGFPTKLQAFNLYIHTYMITHTEREVPTWDWTFLNFCHESYLFKLISYPENRALMAEENNIGNQKLDWILGVQGQPL